MRTALTIGDMPSLSPLASLNRSWPDLPFGRTGNGKVLIEGTQGYGLGLHTRFYPQTTSSDCRAIDFLAMAGINPWDVHMNSSFGLGLRVWVVARVYPIRVAGNSGPLRGEMSWDALGLPEERTTVTQKVRRVGLFDPDLLAEAVRANGGSPVVKVALTMVDQMFPECAGATTLSGLSGEAVAWLRMVEDTARCEIGMVGTSPTTVVELGDEWSDQ
jgi:adenylosuccinate synthase